MDALVFENMKLKTQLKALQDKLKSDPSPPTKPWNNSMENQFFSTKLATLEQQKIKEIKQLQQDHAIEKQRLVSKVAALERELQNKEKEVNGMHGNSSTRISAMENELQRKNRELTELQEKFNEWNNRPQQNSKELNELQWKCRELNDEREQWMEKAESMENELTYLKTKNNEQSKMLHKKKEQMRDQQAAAMKAIEVVEEALDVLGHDELDSHGDALDALILKSRTLATLAIDKNSAFNSTTRRLRRIANSMHKVVKEREANNLDGLTQAQVMSVMDELVIQITLYIQQKTDAINLLREHNHQIQQYQKYINSRAEEERNSQAGVKNVVVKREVSDPVPSRKKVIHFSFPLP